METRERTTITQPSYLIGSLREEARRRNKSVSRIVEEKLTESTFFEPNEATAEAIAESLEGKYAGVIDLSSNEAFLKSVGL